jgi:hypothetical protein
LIHLVWYRWARCALALGAALRGGRVAPAGKGRITTANLRKRLGAFYPNMPAKDFRFLMHSKVRANESKFGSFPHKSHPPRRKFVGFETRTVSFSRRGTGAR